MRDYLRARKSAPITPLPPKPTQEIALQGEENDEDDIPPIQAVPVPAGANLEDAFNDVFKTSKSGTGEEELLRIASQFSLQVTAKQMRCLIYLLHRAERSKNSNDKLLLQLFVRKWLEYKQNNNSDVFVMKALEHISLRHYINENSFKVNIEK